MNISNVILSGRRGKLGLSLLALQALLPVQKAQVAQKGTVVKASMDHNDQMFNFSDLMDIHDVPVKDIDPAEAYIEDDKNNKRSSKQYHARGEQKLKSVVGKKPVHTNPLLMGLMNKGI